MNVPKLRFKEFNEEWKTTKVDSFLSKISNPVAVEEDKIYQEIGIRSHGKGIFHKNTILGKELGNKRVFWVVPESLIVNIVFAWEQAIAVTSKSENGLIASHRFPMYQPKEKLSNIHFLKYLFLTEKGKNYLGLASPGGAGRNKTLGQKNFDELKINIPSLPEQTKIATFLTIIDEKITLLTQKLMLLKQYKKGIIQQIFSQQLRFKDDNGEDFGEWRRMSFNQCVNIFDNLRVPVASSERIKGNIPYYGANGIQSYVEGFTHDGEFILIAEDGANDLINYPIQYANGKIWVNNHAHVVSAKMELLSNKFLLYMLASMNIAKHLVGGSRPKLNASEMRKIEFLVPSLPEQTEIANFLSSIDQKIQQVAAQLDATKQYKRGLLQQMFV